MLGAPWAIPFEFPVYQLIVAALAHLPIRLDVAGRIVNYAFFVMTLVPLGMLARTLSVSRSAFLSVAILFIFSPIYLYWSRTFLIEDCALFFSFLWLALAARFLQKPQAGVLTCAIAAGCLGVLAKSTTMAPFLLLAGLGTLWVLYHRFRAGQRAPNLLALAFGFAAMSAVPLAVGFAWVAYSDAVKEKNEFGAYLTSSALSGWNFGNLGEKVGAHLWRDIVLGRVLPDSLGALHLLGMGTLGLAFILAWMRGGARSSVLAGAATLGFLVPFVVFTNLHIVHPYYQVANAVFIVVAVGLAIGLLFDEGRWLLAACILVLLVGGQVSYFWEKYKPIVETNQKYNSLYLAGLIAKEHTSPGQSILVFGDDWSSAVPYYAERKGLAVPGWIPPDLLKRVMADPQAFLGDRPLGAIVACYFGQPDLPNQGEFLAGRRLIGDTPACRVLSPERN